MSAAARPTAAATASAPAPASRHAGGNTADFALDTASFAGPLEEKLTLAREAGFAQVMLGAHDLVDHPAGPEAATRLVRASGLRVTALRVRRDFRGLAGPDGAYDAEVARSMLALCRDAGSRLLVVRSPVPDEGTDVDALARDLRKLGMLGVPLGLRIACDDVPRERHATSFPPTWDAVLRADMPNLGVAIDLLHGLHGGWSVDDIDLLTNEKLFLVQLADAREAPRPFRVFPGDGVHRAAIAEWMLRLHALEYRRDYCLHVSNDDFAQVPGRFVAERAMRSALWLGEDVLRRSVPLPGAARWRRGG